MATHLVLALQLALTPIPFAFNGEYAAVPCCSELAFPEQYDDWGWYHHHAFCESEVTPGSSPGAVEAGPKQLDVLTKSVISYVDVSGWDFEPGSHYPEGSSNAWQSMYDEAGNPDWTFPFNNFGFHQWSDTLSTQVPTITLGQNQIAVAVTAFYDLWAREDWHLLNVNDPWFGPDWPDIVGDPEEDLSDYPWYGGRASRFHVQHGYYYYAWSIVPPSGSGGGTGGE